MTTRDGLAQSKTDPVRERRQPSTRTLERGLDLLEEIVARPISLSELAQSSAMSRTTLRRLAQVLMIKRLITMDASGILHAGPGLLQMGSAVERQTDLLRLARHHLQQLAMVTGHTAFLGRRDGDHSVHLLRCEGREAATVVAGPGTRRYLAETSLGRALLLDESVKEVREATGLAYGARPAAELEDAIAAGRQSGFAISHGMAPDFIRGIASPVRDASGRIVAAISIASADMYLSFERMGELAPTVRETAANLSRMLGYSPGHEAIFGQDAGQL